MNKYDFTKGILDQLGKPASRNNNPNGKENINAQMDQWREAATQPKSNGPEGLNLLVVFTGTNIGIDKALNELRKSKKYGINFDIAFSWNGKDILDIKNIQNQLGARNVFTEVDKGKIGPILQRVDGIVVPMTTQNTTSKLSQGILDDFVSTLLWEGLWRGKKVVLNLDSVVAYKGLRSKVPVMQQMVEEMIQKVEKMGVVTLYGQDYQKVLEETFCKNKAMRTSIHTKAQGFSSPMQSPKKTGEKTILTEKDIMNLNSPLKVLSVPFDAVITPLAKDRAKAMGIEIKKEQG